MNPLISQLREILGDSASQVGVSFYHLVTGEAWSLNDRPFPSASLIKLPIMAACYQAALKGELALNDMLPVIPAGDPDGCFDNLSYCPSESRFTLRKLLDRMITESDNTATNALIDRLGPLRIQSFIDDWGLPNTRFGRKMLDWSAREAGLENWTSPGDMILFLKRLHEGADFPECWRQEMWSLLTHQRDRTKMARRLSPSLDLAHKTGELDTVTHDVGRISPEYPYLLAIMTEGLGDCANSLIGRIAQAVVEHYRFLPQQYQALSTLLETKRSEMDSRLHVVELDAGWKNGTLTVIGTVTPEVSLDIEGVELDVRVLQPKPGVVVAPKAPVRKMPAHSSEMVSEALLGTSLEILDERGDWYRIRTPDGYLGWIRKGGILEDLEAIAHWESLPAGVVQAPLVWSNGMVLSAGSILRFKDEGWQDPLGNLYPPDTALSQDALMLSPKAIVQTAQRFLGLPYLWGGKSGWGVDCSGLTQLVAQLCGLMLPRDADQQESVLEVVPRDGLKAGDWVFFPGHVGFYLGEGIVLHASATSARVLEQSLCPEHPDYNVWLDTHFTRGGRPRTF